MKIPVFVSCPTTLSKRQELSKKILMKELDRLRLKPRQLGQSDYPTEFPLKEVYSIAKHCAGGLILGFEQIRFGKGLKIGKIEDMKVKNISIPTAWNNLEAGILFSLNLPLLVFKEYGISGGIFDHGVTDVFIHKMPTAEILKEERKALSSILLKWQSLVSQKYYNWI